MSEPTLDQLPVSLPPRPRRRWFRFLYQFSLRTLLMATTLAAVACWWFLQPQVQEEELAGEHLTLLRQVKIEPLKDGSTPPAGEQADATEITSIGSWQLRGEHGDLLVDGRYDQNQPHGQWTAWHANGAKAVEGEVARGLRTGVWRVWDEAGQLRSEATYRVIERSQHVAVEPPSPFSGLPGNFGSISFKPPVLMTEVRHITQRHGPARGWHENGQLEFDGQYADDERDGLWTYYDATGNIVTRGKYQNDLREGLWTDHAIGVAHRRLHVPREDFVSRSETPTMVRYFAGRTQDDYHQLLSRLAAEIASGDLSRQLAAAARLEKVGAAGVPLLVKLFDQPSDEAKLLALRALIRTNDVPAELLSSAEPLVAHADPRLAVRAMLVVYVHEPARREALFAQILAALDKVDAVETHAEALRLVCQVDTNRRDAAFLHMLETLAKDASSDRYLGHWQWLLSFEVDPLPLLIQAFASPDRDVRLYVLLVLEQVVERGPGQQKTLPGGGSRQEWEIPASVQAVLAKAKNDPDPLVREQAECVGNSTAGSGGLGGPAGGFGCVF